MSTVRYPLRDAKPGHFSVRKREIEQFDPPTRRPEAPYQAQIAPTGKRGLERKVPPLGNVLFDLLEEQPAGREELLLGRQWREARGNEVCIDEGDAGVDLGKVLQSEGGFPGTVRSGDDTADR